ncbi:hypothetical protein GCM10009609_72910 [Pseudonocardia aurantiaca]
MGHGRQHPGSALAPPLRCPACVDGIVADYLITLGSPRIRREPGAGARENPPHHGSRYTSVAFRNAVSPRAVLVSVGAGNRYRHPDPGLIGGLERGGAAVRSTDTAGDIAVVGRPAEEDLQVVSRGSPLAEPR